MQGKWDKARIQQYITDGIEESSLLEYKAADALGRDDKKKKEITKDVSAMANSAGGILIYGVKEYDDEPRRHLPEKIDGIDRVAYSREWLDQIIGNIQPRIDGVRIYPVDVDGGHTIYVVEIPQSTTAHQATDNKYYKRSNFVSVPMEGFEVRDVMNRVTLPNAQVEFSYHTIGETQEHHDYKLIVVIRNVGIRVIEDFKLMFTFPNFGPEIHPPNRVNTPPPMWNNINSSQDQNHDFIVVCRSWEKLFPEEEIDISEVINFTYRIDSGFYMVIRNYELNWVLFADDMPPKRGAMPLIKLQNF